MIHEFSSGNTLIINQEIRIKLQRFGRELLSSEVERLPTRKIIFPHWNHLVKQFKSG